MVVVDVVGRGGGAPLLPLHGHVKVAFNRETPAGGQRARDKQRRKLEHEREE